MVATMIVLTEIQPCTICCLYLNLEFVWRSTAYMVVQHGLYDGANQFSSQTQLLFEVRVEMRQSCDNTFFLV